MVTFVTFFITSNEIYDGIYFGFQILVLSYSCSQRPLNYLAFQSFDFDRTWRSLLQKHIVCTKLDIYVFISKISNDRKESITMQNSQFT